MSDVSFRKNLVTCRWVTVLFIQVKTISLSIYKYIEWKQNLIFIVHSEYIFKTKLSKITIILNEKQEEFWEAI